MNCGQNPWEIDVLAEFFLYIKKNILIFLSEEESRKNIVDVAFYKIDEIEELVESCDLTTCAYYYESLDVGFYVPEKGCFLPNPVKKRLAEAIFDTKENIRNNIFFNHETNIKVRNCGFLYMDEMSKARKEK